MVIANRSISVKYFTGLYPTVMGATRLKGRKKKERKEKSNDTCLTQ